MNIRIKTHLILLAGVILLGLSSCSSTKSSARLYAEQSISPDKVKIRTVAIVPNRMPITMQDPELWRSYNWQLIADIFTAKGYRVVDYNTTVNSFTRSSLPLEDTKNSRDKYADFANELNAELIVIPYYGTTYAMESGIFANKHKFLSMGSLQFYYTPKNDFLARVDFDAEFRTSTNGQGLYILAGIVPTIIGSIAGDPDVYFVMSFVSLGLNLGLIVKDLMAPTKPMPNWKKAYKKGIASGTQVFFDKYGSGSSEYNYGTPRQVAPSESLYKNFSLEELTMLKQKAVENKDYKKASEIKAEMDRRK